MTDPSKDDAPLFELFRGLRDQVVVVVAGFADRVVRRVELLVAADRRLRAPSLETVVVSTAAEVLDLASDLLMPPEAVVPDTPRTTPAGPDDPE